MFLYQPHRWESASAFLRSHNQFISSSTWLLAGPLAAGVFSITSLGVLVALSKVTSISVKWHTTAMATETTFPSTSSTFLNTLNKNGNTSISASPLLLLTPLVLFASSVPTVPALHAMALRLLQIQIALPTLTSSLLTLPQAPRPPPACETIICISNYILYLAINF